MFECADATGYGAAACEICFGSLERRDVRATALVCSEQCRSIKAKAYSKARTARLAALRGPKKAPGFTIPCKWCGLDFRSPFRHRVYCSRPCVAASLSVLNRVKPLQVCPTCGKEFKPYRQSARQKRNGYRVVHCSYACAGAPRVARLPDARARRRLRDTDAVDPIKVCERDGWRCHLCGISTPRRLRGTTEDRAPEVDHIVTIADGGAHEYANVACACRRCNRHKGARSFGQLLLFG